MKNYQTIGKALLLGASGVLIPYVILSIIFDYPKILREDTGVILTHFHEGGSPLIFTWLAFALLGLPLIVAYKRIGAIFAERFAMMNWVTTIGVAGLLFQLVGLLRWVFVVPVLATHYINGNDDVRETSRLVFQVVHQFGGVLLGEHLGQFFTITWTVCTAYVFSKSGFFPKWTSWLAYTASAIYLLAQMELLATVIPGFPVFALAGFIGSTLWIVWLLIMGFLFRKKNSVCENSVNLTV